jgi:hypothetical protein
MAVRLHQCYAASLERRDQRRLRNILACKRQRETRLRKVRATRRGREPGFSVIQDHVPVTNHLAPRMGAVMRHMTWWRQASCSLRKETLETNSPS